MQRRIILTEDGSHSISIPGWNVTYHSKHGAIQESQHIFIEAGLKQLLPSRKSMSIFEMGFGTGLNALLTYINGFPVQINYETVEIFPVTQEEVLGLNYVEQTCGSFHSVNYQKLRDVFLKMHQAEWNQAVSLSSNFSFCKINEDLGCVEFSKKYDLIYFDAFDPVVQPELWGEDIFKRLYRSMNKGGLLLTYCSKGSVRRAMEAAGFGIEKIPGPKGKREIIRARVV